MFLEADIDTVELKWSTRYATVPLHQKANRPDWESSMYHLWWLIIRVALDLLPQVVLHRPNSEVACHQWTGHCMFCQKKDKKKLQKVIINHAKTHPVMKTRLEDVTDIKAAEACYHLQHCVQFGQKSKQRSSKSSGEGLIRRVCAHTVWRTDHGVMSWLCIWHG